MSQLLDARHAAASAAGAISNVAGYVARAMAWPAEQRNTAATISDLQTALGLLAQAEQQLVSAIVRLRIAQEEGQPQRALDDEELETILVIARNGQSGRITEFEIKQLVAAYRERANANPGADASGHPKRGQRGST